MTMNHSILFSPFQLGDLLLKNRIVMAPLTRNRALPGMDAPHALNATYYAQRADAALIISEATQISPSGKGYAWTPGIYSKQQLEGWKLITKAVHNKGGKIFAQLWHVGRISHPSLQPHEQLPVAPSAIAPTQQKTFIESGEFVTVGTPRALTYEEIETTIDDYRNAAIHAIEAGFDGVEIHAANGYLLQQFLCDGSNQRTDSYGGSIHNRMQLTLDVAKAIISAIGEKRTGIRLSPNHAEKDLVNLSSTEVYFPLVQALNELNLVYIHVIEGMTGGPRELNGFDFEILRKSFHGAWMVNNGYSESLAIEAISRGYADLVAFGRPFIANPDLVRRFRENAPLNSLDQSTLYGGDSKGYTDYPILK